MTERHTHDNRLTRWRERRSAKRQAALEREFHQQDRLDPSTRAYGKGKRPLGGAGRLDE